MISLSNPRVQCVLLIVIAAVLFWPGLSGDFLFDDYPNIVANESVQATTLDSISLRKAATAYNPDGGMLRPLPGMWFAIDHVIGGKNPWVYKFSGLLVHLVNALLILVLARRLLTLPSARLSTEFAVKGAFAVAVIWAIHPLQVSTVLYVVQRMETLSLTFVLLALLVYLRGRQRQIDGVLAWPFLLACLPLMLLGLACKESALLFPAYALALELTVLRFAASDAATSRAWRWGYAVSTGLALLVFFSWVVPHYANDSAYAFREFSLYERLLTQCRVLPMYLAQMLLPLPGSMIFYYDALPVSQGWLSPPSTLAGAVLLAVLLGLAWASRERRPLLSLGLLIFFAAHVLTSNVVALELAFEHRNYFALFGVLLALAAIAAELPERVKPAAFGLLLPVMTVAIGLLALLRAATWGDAFMLSTDLVAKAPMSARASSDLAALYMGAAKGNPASPHFATARAEFERASLLPGSSPLPEQGLIVMAATSGQVAEDVWWTRLIGKLRTARIGPQEVMSVTGLLKLRESTPTLNDQRLLEACQTLLANSKQTFALHVLCGRHALVNLGDEAAARVLFLQAVEQGHTDPEKILEIIKWLVAEDRQLLAQSMFTRARELGLVDVDEGALRQVRSANGNPSND